MALAAYLVATNLWLHRFWAVPSELQFAQQIRFMKNLSLVGALLFIAGSAAPLRR